MAWIKHRHGEAIPQELYYPDYQTDEDSEHQKPLMIWIEYRKGEAIPQELYYPGCQTDEDRWG